MVKGRKDIKVLIVDDSNMTRNYHAYILRSAGFKIGEASDGYEALEKLLTDEYDIVLSDINMPRMDGITFIKTVREQADEKIREIPIIIISTEDEAEDKRKGFEAGCDFYIVKPVNPEKLVKSIEMLVKKRGGE